ncbi:MAG: flagellar biosynthesis protein FlhB [Candidatus Brocadiia bacterium]
MPPDSQQKTEKPTQRRRRKAREEGEVAQSMEVNNAFVLMAGVGALLLFGGHGLNVLIGQMADRLRTMGEVRISPEAVISAANDAFGVMAKTTVPVMVMVAAMGLACSVVQTGVLVTPKKILPKLRNINPIQGLKNLFSLSAVMRLLTSAVKLAVIGLIVFFLVKSRLAWFPALVGKSPWGMLDVTTRLCTSLMVRVIAAMLFVAVLDYAYQRWRHEKQLRMTRQEVKEERKRDEGDPEVRSRQGQMRRRIARQRMMQAVPAADVVVANPTHVAVALQWDEDEMDAPTVVAKGADLLAERIKQIARENDVPVLERRELARTLYDAVEVGTEVPARLYYAVAQVLAFVMRQKRPA